MHDPVPAAAVDASSPRAPGATRVRLPARACRGARALHAAALLAVAALGVAAAGGAIAADPSFALSGATPAAGYELVDRGVMVMRGGPMERREVFETWRAPSGEHWQRSVVTPADGSYRVEGEWRSDATGLQQTARGRGAIEAETLEIAIEAQPGRAALTIRRGDHKPEILDGRCTPDCFIDLSPSAVAMFAMTRDARVEVGKAREFRWVGHALNADSVLVDGVARFLRLGEQQLRRPDGSVLTVRHDVFQESVSDLRTGFRAKVFFNLWTDAAGRPLKFASSRTVGLREGYEDLGALAPASLENAFPEPAAR